MLFVAFHRVCHPSFHKFAHTRICRQSEHIVDPKGVTQIYNLRGAVVAVGPKQNPGIRPMSADQRLPLTFELASLATTLGVRHGLVILDAQQYHSGGCLVGGTSVKGGIVFERVLICYGPVGNISASSGLFILLDMAR